MLWRRSAACRLPFLLGLGVAASAVSLHSPGRPSLKGAQQSAYFWPRGHGRSAFSTASQYKGPRNLSEALAWTWHHPDGRFHTTLVGAPLIDDVMNIYLAAEDGIRKFNPSGRLLWTYTPTGHGPICTCPSLLSGALFGSTQKGSAFAIDMETGRERWVAQVGRSVAGGAGFVEAQSNVVVAAVDADDSGGNVRVLALAPSNGSLLWEFHPEQPVRDFSPSFAGADGTSSLIFQDQNAAVYRLELESGRLLWKTSGQSLLAPGGEVQSSRTAGAAIVGPDGVVYSVGLWAPRREEVRPDTPGSVRAHRLSDGKLLWHRQVPRPPDASPALAQLGRRKAPSLLVPLGKEAGLPGIEYIPWWVPDAWKLAFHRASLALGERAMGLWHNRELPTGLMALDARTGSPTWTFEAPAWKRIAAAGDEEGYLTRKELGIRPACLPAAWSSPVVDAEGTVYIGNQNGKLYAVRDKNGDGHIDRRREVSSFDTGAAFLRAGPSLAPGMMAVATCDTLFVFRV